MSCEYVIGIDIGGTNLRMGMVTRDMKLHNYLKQDSSILASGGQSLENLYTCIKEYNDKNSFGKLVGVAVGFPAAVAGDRKTVYSTPNIPGFDNVNVVDFLENRLKVPVFLDRDVNHLLLWDIAQSNISTQGTILGFYIGTGFGNSIYMNGKFLSGKNGVAGELGHIPVLNSNLKCGCGNTGCIEAHVAGKGLESIITKYYPDVHIKDIFNFYHQSTILQEYVDGLSVPIATEVNILDPDHAFIGGGIVNMKGFPRKDFEENIFRRLRKPYPASNFSFSYSVDSQESGVFGAAIHAFESLICNKE